MGRSETRLEELGLTLPAPLVPPGTFQLVKVHTILASLRLVLGDLDRVTECVVDALAAVVPDAQES